MKLDAEDRVYATAEARRHQFSDAARVFGGESPSMPLPGC
jgi:hypothetical protein